MIGIYKITNRINGKIYIGQSIDIQYRWKQHLKALNDNKYSHLKIYQAFKKYGIENFSFEIIEQCTENDLDEREKYWIKYYDSYNSGYNMTIGGTGGDIKRYDIEKIQKMWDQGYRTNDIKEAIGCSLTTIHKRLHGYKDFNYASSRLRNFNYAQQYGQVIQSTALRTSIYQYELNGKYVQEFKSIKDAAAAMNGQSDSISMVLSGKRKTAFGYFWSREKKDNMPPVAAPNGKLVRHIPTSNIYSSINQAARENNIQADIIKTSCEKRKNNNNNLNFYEWEYVS